MNEAVREADTAVKVLGSWRRHEWEHLLRKAEGTEWSQPKREAMWASTKKVTGVGPPKPLQTHIFPPHAPGLDGH